MKKLLVLLYASLFLCANAMARHNVVPRALNNGGFVDKKIQMMSISDVKKQPDDTYVAMQGYVTKRLSKNTYSFSDGTEQIDVEIKGKVWQGQNVSPQDKVMIEGEVDREDGMIIVEVWSIRKQDEEKK